MARKDTEKVAIGALRQALQAWLAPQLSGMSDRLVRIEGRLDGLEKHLEGRLDGIEGRLDGLEKRMVDGFAALNKRIDDIHGRFDDLRDSLKIHERLARLEAERGLKSETSA